VESAIIAAKPPWLATAPSMLAVHSDILFPRDSDDDEL
jgi:hypothetical protein